jgi:DNA-binding MarR family transcriptional regulator
MPPRRRAVPGLPGALLGEPPTVKLVWLWLSSQGVVDYSQREIARALGVEPRAMASALDRLRALGLLEDVEREPRKRGKLRARTSP